MKNFILLFSLILLSNPIFAQNNSQQLPQAMTAEEAARWPQYLKNLRESSGTRRLQEPEGLVHSLGEWEEAEAVMTLWNNKSLLKALSENGNVKILTGSEGSKQSWLQNLTSYGLDTSKFSFYIVPTNSMWVRDYGPWWIVDGKGTFGIVDNIYNRPRPADDVVPDFVAKQIDVPIFKTNLVHTGGNYYSDGMGKAFSSTLVLSENSDLKSETIMDRALRFLGIQKYTTSELGKSITIEHLDTFGKLVSPDTWVFSKFSENSRFYADSERMVKLLESQKSPYGTPYKIFRLRMVERNGGGEDYRAYINSFVSNGVLYFPAYKDSVDQEVQAIYQAALPGYKIVPVDNGGTEWGDSVHCRTRNLIQKNNIFIFPKIETGDDLTVTADIFPSKGNEITQAEVVVLNGNSEQLVPMAKEGTKYVAHLRKEDHLKIYVRATDSSGLHKQHPRYSPITL